MKRDLTVEGSQKVSESEGKVTGGRKKERKQGKRKVSGVISECVRAAMKDSRTRPLKVTR